MGFFKKDQPKDEGPSLEDAWKMLGGQLGLSVQADGPRSVVAQGTVSGRQVVVEIHGKQRGSEFMRGLSDRRRNWVHVRWSTELRVSCQNPRGLTGTITSAVDVRNPAWNPRIYDPAQCRVVSTEPADLATRVLTPSIYQRLMAVHDDISIEVRPHDVRIAEESKTDTDAGYAVACVIHHFVGPMLPQPDRSIAGPPWWIALLGDIAAAVDG